MARIKFISIVIALCAFAFPVAAQQAAQEAPTGFDGQTNGLATQAEFNASKEEFDGAEEADEGLGPIFNAQACRECHQNPVSGAGSQITELRAGRNDRYGRFQNPDIPLAGGGRIEDRSLVNDRAICPEAQQLVPDREDVRTLRASISIMGDGFVEAVADQTLIDLARQQCTSTRGKICGQVLKVPIVEAPGVTRVGRFGWKNQHASLLSFSADAYLNEMGITSRLLPDEFTTVCQPAEVAVPNDPAPPPGELDAIAHFARFMRALKAPSRDNVLAATPQAQRGSALFDSVGCATCHVRTLVTAPAGTQIIAAPAVVGGMFAIPAALGNKAFHPFGDFLLHNVGTGDGIVQVASGVDATVRLPSREHFGKRARSIQWRGFPSGAEVDSTQYKVRTAPLWGVRMRTRLMHDGASVTIRDAILRHGGEASDVTARFKQLSNSDEEALLAFVRSL